MYWKYYTSKSKWNLEKIENNFQKHGNFILELPNKGKYSDCIFRKDMIILYCDGYKTYQGEVILVSKNDFLYTMCEYLKRPSNKYDVKNSENVLYIKFSHKFEPSENKIKLFKGFQPN
jgi:hypothetical protein